MGKRGTGSQHVVDKRKRKKESKSKRKIEEWKRKGERDPWMAPGGHSLYPIPASSGTLRGGQSRKLADSERSQEFNLN